MMNRQTPPTKLAVVIPAYEHFSMVMRAVVSLMAARESHESARITLHVQDDCSPHVDMSQCVPPEVASVWRTPENIGFAENCNAGAAWVIINKQPAPDVLLFLNQDVYATPELSKGWNVHLMKLFQDDPNIGIVGLRLLFPNNTIQSVGGVFDMADQPHHDHFLASNLHHPLVAQPHQVDWVTGAAIAIRTGLFVKLNGFDEGYVRGYFEDVDICLRAKELGYSTWVQPQATMIHSAGSTGGSPYFKQNAQKFKADWVDSGRLRRAGIPATTIQPINRFW